MNVVALRSLALHNLDLFRREAIQVINEAVNLLL
jgi:hypothetical protein